MIQLPLISLHFINAKLAAKPNAYGSSDCGNEKRPFLIIYSLANL